MADSRMLREAEVALHLLLEMEETATAEAVMPYKP